MSAYRNKVYDVTYRVYVTDCLRYIGHLDGTRYYDAVTDRFKPKETRTGDEIKNDIKLKLRLASGKEG